MKSDAQDKEAFLDYKEQLLAIKTAMNEWEETKVDELLLRIYNENKLQCNALTDLNLQSEDMIELLTLISEISEFIEKRKQVIQDNLYYMRQKKAAHTEYNKQR